MKTSNKLLLTLFAIVLLSVLGANIPLKQAFETMDRSDSDPYFGYARDTLPAFKYIKLTGNSSTLMQIQPGTRYEIRRTNFDFEYNLEGAKLKTEVRGDTLFVLFEKKEDPQMSFWREDPMKQKPAVYIMAPTLSGISSEGLLTKITGWREGGLSFRQTGKSALLTGNQFESLSISAYSGGSVEIEGSNAVGDGTLLVRDSSRVAITKNVFKTFRMQVDSTAHMSLPGSMLKM